MSRNFILGFILFVTSLVVVGCSGTTKTKYENGRHKIVCNNQPHECHERAREICPDGYVVTNRVRPRQKGRARQFQLNIRCRENKPIY